MIVVTKPVIEVINEYGRKTNPKSSEMLRVFKTLVIDQVWHDFKDEKDKIKENDMIFVFNSEPKIAISNIYVNIKKNEITDNKFEIKEDNLKIIGCNLDHIEKDGKLKTTFKFSRIDFKTDDFCDMFLNCINFGSSKLTEEEKNGYNIFEKIIEKTEGKKEYEKVNKEATLLKNIFFKVKYIIIKRDTKIVEKVSGVEVEGTIWLIAGLENDFAYAAKCVSDEFNVLPLTSASAITEIKPR